MKKLYKIFVFSNLLVSLILILNIYSIKGMQFIPPNNEIYNPLVMDISINEFIDDSSGYYILDNTSDYAQTSFYISGNINTSLPIYVVYSITSLTVNNISIKTFLGSSKTNMSQFPTYDIENNYETVVNPSISYAFNIIRVINVGQFDYLDLILIRLQNGNTTSTPFILNSITVYYGVDETDVNFITSIGLEDYEWYILITFMIMILNLVSLKSVNLKFKNMSMLFLIIGILVNSIGLLYLNTPLYPFIQLMGIIYSIIINYGMSEKNER